MAAPQALLDQSNCYQCVIPRGMTDAVMIYLLQQIAGTNMTSNQLLEAAKCYQCIIPSGMAPAVMIYLLDQVVSGGGGGGGTTQIATGVSDPVGAPAAGIVLFVRTDVVRLLKWDGSAWVVEYSEI